MPFEPVLISTPLVPADVGILTNVEKSTMQSADTTDVIYHFDVLSYVFFAIALSMIIVIVTAITVYNDIKTQKKAHGALLIRKVFISSQKTIWEVIALIIDQEYFEPINWSVRIVWNAANIFCFLLIFGYFLNLLSTDQSVQKDSKKIDSIQDLLYDAYFKDITPVILKPLYLFNVLKNVPSSSDEGKLFSYMQSKGSESILDIDISQMDLNGPIKAFVSDLAGGKSAFITARYGIDLVQLLPKMFSDNQDFKTRDFYVSKQSFLHGTLNVFYSKRIHPHVKQYIDYR